MLNDETIMFYYYLIEILKKNQYNFKLYVYSKISFLQNDTVLHNLNIINSICKGMLYVCMNSGVDTKL